MSAMDCSKHKKCNKKCKKTAVLCKKITDPVDLDICGLCLGPEDDIELYGKFFRDESQQLAVHQYCMFFASGLAQNGEDHEDFDGFLFKDIKKEIKRASKLRCTGCYGRGAATGCNVKKCRSNFHFKCGLNSFALFQFFGSFCAFCKKHRPTQERTTIDLQALHLQPVCPICLVNIDGKDHYSSLNSPCCKNAWFHKSCVQKQALANGKHYFRCAFCNNVDKFQEEMKRMGIHIPERDAIWEQNNAYADLLEQYNKCDSKLCLCPKGRSFSGKHHGMRWKLCLCKTCGQSGTHTKCQGWTETPERWICSDCIICFPEETNKSQYDFLESSSTSEVPSPILIESACSSPLSDQEDNIPLREWWHAQETICNNNAKTQHDSSIKEDNSQSLTCKSIGSSSVGSTEVEVDASETMSNVDVILGKQESKKENTDYHNDSHSIPEEKRRRKPKYLVPGNYKKVKVKPKNKADRRAVRDLYAKRKELSKKLQEDKHVATIQNNSEIDGSFSLSLPVTPESDNQDLSVVTTCSEKNINFNNSQSDFEAFLKAVKHETELPSPVQQSVQPTYDNEQATSIIQSPLTNESTTTADSPSSADSPPSELISCTAEVRHPYGKRKQGDIRGMFFPVDVKKKKKAIFNCAVEDCGCQTTFKKKRSIKKRKLNTSSPTESKSITMYMCPLSGSPPERKKRQRLSSCDSASHQPDNLDDTSFDHGQTSKDADKSNSMYDTVTSAAKGMFMRALENLGSQSDNCRSEAHVDDMDCDNSDSIIVTKVLKRSPGDYQHTILTGANCKLPSYKHEKHCEYHRHTPNKRCHASSDTVDPSSVIVIDDDDSDQTMEMGESDEHCSNSTADKGSSNMSNEGDSLPASCNLSNSSLLELNETSGTSSTIGSSVYDSLWHLECDAPSSTKKQSTPLSTSCNKRVDEVDNKKNTARAEISRYNKHEHSKQVHPRVSQKGLEMIVNNCVVKLEESQEECKTNHHSRTNDIGNNIGKDDITDAKVLPLQNHTHRNSGGFFSPLKRKSKAYSTKTQKPSKNGKHHNECSDEDFQTRKSNKITRKRPKEKYKGKVY